MSDAYRIVLATALLLSRHPRIDHVLGAGDIGGFVRGQKQHEARHFPGRGDARKSL